MEIVFEDEVFSSDDDGAHLFAEQATKAKTTVQIASLDGSSPAWIPLEPCLLVVSRGRAIRVQGAELDNLISACRARMETR